jgi:hypothetical protein
MAGQAHTLTKLLIFKTMEKYKKNSFFEKAFKEIEEIIQANIDEDGQLTGSVSELETDLENLLTTKCKESFKNGIEVGKNPRDRREPSDNKNPRDRKKFRKRR